MTPSANPIYQHDTYLVRKKILTLAGAKFHVTDPAGQLVGFSKLKAFKLKEDIRLYTGEDMTTELLSIQARQIIDFSAAYDVVDASTGEKLGALKRKGLKSLIKDEWIIMDINDAEVGLIKEDNMLLALLRRFITPLIPQNYECDIQGQSACTFRQNLNPFVTKITVAFSKANADLLDHRLGIAAAILLCAIEGKQE